MWDSRVMKHGLRLGFNGQFDDFDDFDDKGRPVLITAAAPRMRWSIAHGCVST